MPISNQHKLILVHVPKNAGTSITNHLNMVDVGHHNWSYYAVNYPNKWREYKKISIIRNPWDRAVSCYEYAKMENSYWHSCDSKSKSGKHPDYELLKDKSFTECLNILKETPNKLKHQGWTNQLDYISKNNKIMVDHTICIESINKELSDILGEKIEIPIVNKSNNNRYQDYYINNDLIEIVKNHYLLDIESFNFKFSKNI